MKKGIGSWLNTHSHRFKNKTALVYNDVRLTYRQLNNRVNRLANALSSLGIGQGDRVNALLLNTNELMESMFACAKIRAIFVPINTRLGFEELEYIVNDSGGTAFLFDERLKSVASGLQERVSRIQHYVQVGATPEADFELYESLIARFPADEPAYDVSLDDVHMLMYTSGTTGKPKGAMITHGNTLWNAINANNALPFHAKDITLTVAPLFHIGGMNIFTTPSLYLGGTVILCDKFDPKIVLELIEKEKVTTLFLVPAMWLAIMQYPDFSEYDISSLKLNISGGAPCPLTVIEFFQKRGVPFFEGFGLTETAPFVSILDEGETIRKKGSVGRTPIHTEVRIVGPQDMEVPAGEVGELLVKGPNVFVGYWNNPEETRKAIKSTWFYTGDLAKKDEEGFLYIVDRKKDMIISGGENIYPIEVEQVLYRIPNVKEVAVVGVPDEKWGESVKAYIALLDPEKSLTLEDVKLFCEGKLARFKVPKHLEIIESLPRNATGKILKTVLRNKQREGKGIQPNVQ
ncbi:acyl-CoA synthetase [Bacillus sp. T33-2]|uniref:acyl-CoA synthetase n=1 Tax=Bacillus sp. T33-2 TaxID=2054168 RepID=UPI001C60A4FA|nr:long-chain fatty acid--CoA ligase [Bacillus sp. T33-2]